MCGVFGLIVNNDERYGPAFIKKSLKTLVRLSESRGKDSSGFVFRNDSRKELKIFKGALSLSYLLKNKEVRRQINQMLGSTGQEQESGRENTFAMMGHSRLVTNGSQLDDVNNQPVITSRKNWRPANQWDIIE